MRIQLHNMPQDRTTADFYHGLGTIFSLFTQARAQSAAKHDHFHEILLAGVKLIVLFILNMLVKQPNAGRHVA